MARKKKEYYWYFHLRGMPLWAYGPMGPMTKDEFLDYLRRKFGNGKRIPYGTQYWIAYNLKVY